jgi:hypothetical protein
MCSRHRLKAGQRINVHHSEGRWGWAKAILHELEGCYEEGRPVPVVRISRIGWRAMRASLSNTCVTMGCHGAKAT